MHNNKGHESKSITLDFNVVSPNPSLNLIELVRHLARIAAENDYKDFLNSIEKRYTGDLKKGPPQ
ncbi:hypothetical protein [Novosphingobium resinovorum]|uniref:hypothetical protein n=1 Tax=Novosphingobium resinovorum TaxID=158500 RepID=UPI002ED5EFFE|nr:hypothetical protein [Novosphingobium resinovorum]